MSLSMTSAAASPPRSSARHKAESINKKTKNKIRTAKRNAARKRAFAANPLGESPFFNPRGCRCVLCRIAVFSFLLVTL